MKLKKKNNFGKKTDTPTNNGTDDVIEDDRFKIVHYDPRFAKASKKITKLSIDDRFKAMFKDPKFKILTKVDRLKFQKKTRKLKIFITKMMMKMKMKKLKKRQNKR